MIKYTVKKLPYVEGFVWHYIYKTVNKKQLSAMLEDGWEVVSKENIIETFYKEKWVIISSAEKVAIVSLIIALLSFIFK